MKITPILYTTLLLSQTSCSMAGQLPSTTALTEQQQFLLKSVQQTPFSAVVNITDVSIRPVDDDPDMVWHIFSATVISPVRGSSPNTLRFAMVVEKEEEAIIPDKPVLLTLCTARNLAVDTDFYWPGTGAMFEARPELVELAIKATKSLASEQTDFAQCD